MYKTYTVFVADIKAIILKKYLNLMCNH